MDSMRSLNKSLPSTRSSRPSPPGELLPAFRQAALSVTNLYKAAANYHDSIRQAGYQEALDELLKFLDKENLGLQDGEGWRVRQWATARYDVSHLQQSDDEDEDAVEQDQKQRDSSPEKPTVEDDSSHSANLRSSPPAASPITTSTRTHPSPQDQSQLTQLPKQALQLEKSEKPVFHFTHGGDSAMQEDESSSTATDHVKSSSSSKFDGISRPIKSLPKLHNRHPARFTNKTLPQATASKRKMPFAEISEMFNLNFERKDDFDGGTGAGSGTGGGGTKRTRFV